MFGLSFEHLLVLGVVLLIFGPKRLPQLGNTLGKAIKNFKDSLNGIEEAQFKRVKEEEPVAQARESMQPETVKPTVETSAT